MTTEAYEDYLKSDRWRENRAGALARAGDRCQVCNGTDHLEVHHRTYERLGNERPEDVTVLCGACHELFHERRKITEVEGMAQPLADLYERIDQKTTGDHCGVSGLPSGYVDLDELTAGFHGGELVVVASYPGVGKSTFLLNLARLVMVPALIISPEHPRLEIVSRLLAAESLVNGHTLRQGVLNSSMMENTINAGAVLLSLPLFLDATPSPSILRVASVAHKAVAAHKIQVVFIDCLDLIQTSVTSYRPEQIAIIARGLKTLARELDVPVIVAARAVCDDKDRQVYRPRLADFGLRSAIPQEADTILLLHTPDRYEPGVRDDRLEVTVAKQRNGPPGDFLLSFNRSLFRIDDMKIDSHFQP